MENYRRIKVIGKGSFGFAVLVQSQKDGNLYVMKVMSFPNNNYSYLSDNRRIKNGQEIKTRHFKRDPPSTKTATPIHNNLQRILYGQKVPSIPCNF